MSTVIDIPDPQDGPQNKIRIEIPDPQYELREEKSPIAISPDPQDEVSHDPQDIPLIAISPNGKYLVTYNGKDKEFIEWNVSKNEICSRK